MGLFCLKCGVIGIEEYLVFCRSCKVNAEHRYCMDVIPEWTEADVNWSCLQCSKNSPEANIKPSSRVVLKSKKKKLPVTRSSHKSNLSKIIKERNLARKTSKCVTKKLTIAHGILDGRTLELLKNNDRKVVSQKETEHKQKNLQLSQSSELCSKESNHMGKCISTNQKLSPKNDENDVQRLTKASSNCDRKLLNVAHGIPDERPNVLLKNSDVKVVCPKETKYVQKDLQPSRLCPEPKHVNKVVPKIEILSLKDVNNDVLRSTKTSSSGKKQLNVTDDELPTNSDRKAVSSKETEYGWQHLLPSQSSRLCHEESKLEKGVPTIQRLSLKDGKNDVLRPTKTSNSVKEQLNIAHGIPDERPNELPKERLNIAGGIQDERPNELPKNDDKKVVCPKEIEYREKHLQPSQSSRLCPEESKQMENDVLRVTKTFNCVKEQLNIANGIPDERPNELPKNNDGNAVSPMGAGYGHKNCQLSQSSKICPKELKEVEYDVSKIQKLCPKWDRDDVLGLCKISCDQKNYEVNASCPLQTSSLAKISPIKANLEKRNVSGDAEPNPENPSVEDAGDDFLVNIKNKMASPARVTNTSTYQLPCESQLGEKRVPASIESASVANSKSSAKDDLLISRTENSARNEAVKGAKNVEKDLSTTQKSSPKHDKNNVFIPSKIRCGQKHEVNAFRSLQTSAFTKTSSIKSDQLSDANRLKEKVVSVDIEVNPGNHCLGDVREDLFGSMKNKTVSHMKAHNSSTNQLLHGSQLGEKRVPTLDKPVSATSSRYSAKDDLSVNRKENNARNKADKDTMNVEKDLSPIQKLNPKCGKNDVLRPSNLKHYEINAFSTIQASALAKTNPSRTQQLSDATLLKEKNVSENVEANPGNHHLEDAREEFLVNPKKMRNSSTDQLINRSLLGVQNVPAVIEPATGKCARDPGEDDLLVNRKGEREQNDADKGTNNEADDGAKNGACEISVNSATNEADKGAKNKADNSVNNGAHEISVNRANNKVDTDENNGAHEISVKSTKNETYKGETNKVDGGVKNGVQEISVNSTKNKADNGAKNRADCGAKNGAHDILVNSKKNKADGGATNKSDSGAKNEAHEIPVNSAKNEAYKDATNKADSGIKNGAHKISVNSAKNEAYRGATDKSDSGAKNGAQEISLNIARNEDDKDAKNEAHEISVNSVKNKAHYGATKRTKRRRLLLNVDSDEENDAAIQPPSLELNNPTDNNARSVSPTEKSKSKISQLIQACLPPNFKHFFPRPVWRGSFNIEGVDYGPIVAHSSRTICERAYNTLQGLPQTFVLEKHPRLDIYPPSFKLERPTEHRVALYFFSADPSVGNRFSMVVDELIVCNQALRMPLGVADLLVFSSLILPAQSWLIENEYYLWGVVRKARSQPADGEVQAEVRVKTEL